jgi:hypothetical protein
LSACDKIPANSWNHQSFRNQEGEKLETHGGIHMTKGSTRQADEELQLVRIRISTTHEYIRPRRMQSFVMNIRHKRQFLAVVTFGNVARRFTFPFALAGEFARVM